MGMSMAQGGSQLPSEGGKVVHELGISPPLGGCRYLHWDIPQLMSDLGK